MSSMHKIILNGGRQRELVKRYADVAPEGYVVEFRPPGRTLSQNNKLWAMLTEISRSKPNGLVYTPDQWKHLFLSAMNYEVLYMEGLNGEPVPVSPSTRGFTSRQMSDVIEYIYTYCAENGVCLRDIIEDSPMCEKGTDE